MAEADINGFCAAGVLAVKPEAAQRLLSGGLSQNLSLAAL
jgi:hypothetical protein